MGVVKRAHWPTADLRSPDEPLLGITGPEATPGTVEAAPRGPS